MGDVVCVEVHGLSVSPSVAFTRISTAPRAFDEATFQKHLTNAKQHCPVSSSKRDFSQIRVRPAPRYRQGVVRFRGSNRRSTSLPLFELAFYCPFTFLLTWRLVSLLRRLGSRTTFDWRRNTEQFCETGLVRLAGRAIAIGLNPFGVLNTQVIMDLSLKLNVRADFVGAGWRSVHFHRHHHRRASDSGHCACVGFSNTTREVIRDPSFEIVTSTAANNGNLKRRKIGTVRARR